MWIAQASLFDHFFQVFHPIVTLEDRWVLFFFVIFLCFWCGLIRIMVEIERFLFHNHQRWLPEFISTHKTLFLVVWVVGLATVFLWQSSSIDGLLFFRWALPDKMAPRLHLFAYNITNFGGVGDGVTRNTEAFEMLLVGVHGVMSGMARWERIFTFNFFCLPFAFVDFSSIFFWFFLYFFILRSLDGVGDLEVKQLNVVTRVEEVDGPGARSSDIHIRGEEE